MDEVVFTYRESDGGDMICLICDICHTLKYKFNLTKLGVNSYEELKSKVGQNYHEYK